jgi:23S rRNA pseudouridine955/2504/2580 synthase
MDEYIVTKNSAGQRADRFISKAAPGLSSSAVQKAFRKKDIKRNGKPCRADERLAFGDAVRVYGVRTRGDRLPEAKKPVTSGVKLDIVYEDLNILILNKPAGIPSQPDFEEIARSYAGLPPEPGFVPSLCHRLDRNTGGLLIFAKTAEALRDITQKIKDRKVIKTYRCTVLGVPVPAVGEWRDWLWKDSRQNRVYAREKPSPGAKEALLHYKVLSSKDGKSELEIVLVTGRTHQIRVQCASRGFPIAGDGKYGKGRKGEPLALRAVKLEFDGMVFESGGGSL